MTRPTLVPRLYESLAAIETLRPAWEGLLAEFPTATIFSSLEWLIPWWRAFGDTQQLKIVGFFDAAQRLVALAPFSLTSHRAAGGVNLKFLRLMGDDSFDSDNLDLPVRSGYETAFADALLEYLEGGDFDWDVCELNTLPGDSPGAGAVAACLDRRRWRRFTSERPWFVIDLPSSWEDYVQRLSSQDRNNLERYSRRMQKRYQTRIYKCLDESDLAGSLESLFRLHQKRWELRGEPGTFASTTRRDFYFDLSRTLHRHSSVVLPDHVCILFHCCSRVEASEKPAHF